MERVISAGDHRVLTCLSRLSTFFEAFRRLRNRFPTTAYLNDHRPSPLMSRLRSINFTSQDRDTRASIQTVQSLALIQLTGTIERAFVDHQTNGRLRLDHLLDLNSSRRVCVCEEHGHVDECVT